MKHSSADTELIDRAQAGDAAAFAVLTEQYYRTVYRYAYTWCRTREDAEDIAQEVFVKLGRAITTFDHRSRFTSWLYRVTANCARDYLRRNRNWDSAKAPVPPPGEQTVSPDPGPEDSLITRNILRLVDTLPDKQKEAILLVYGEGLNHSQAARVIGCAETTVSWRLFQAKRSLKNALDKDGSGPGAGNCRIPGSIAMLFCLLRGSRSRPDPAGLQEVIIGFPAWIPCRVPGTHFQNGLLKLLFCAIPGPDTRATAAFCPPVAWLRNSDRCVPQWKW